MMKNKRFNQKIMTLFLLLQLSLLTACKQEPSVQPTEIDPETEISNNQVDTQENEFEQELTRDNPLGNGSYYMRLAGLMTYPSFEGEKYQDTPSEGHEYLVLYLDIENYGENDYYFNPECMYATVDGVEVENTFLLNDPEGYQTIFRKVEVMEREIGFVVWEVPKDWTNFTFNYRGFRDTESVDIYGHFTHEDLFDIDKEKFNF